MTAIKGVRLLAPRIYRSATQGGRYRFRVPLYPELPQLHAG